ncbi:class I adenylate-forming enzyme family protein [Crossiella sp. NPDC003009]
MNRIRTSSAVLFDTEDAPGGPPWTDLSSLLADAARRHGDREFLRCPDRSVSFGEAGQRTLELAEGLRAAGFGPGDRVAIMAANLACWPLLWLAVLRAGAVAVPVDIRCRSADLAHVLADSGSTAVLTSDRDEDLVRSVLADLGAAVPVHTESTLARTPAGAAGWPVRALANLQYTSGTTGFPKACMLTHEYWLRTAWQIAVHAGLRADDVVLTAQAFSYVDPQWKTALCLMGGVPLVVLPRFSASGFWPSARTHRATLTYVLGTPHPRPAAPGRPPLPPPPGTGAGRRGCRPWRPRTAHRAAPRLGRRPRG